ncbi:hypothetical protein GCM10009863_59990 [Streptomyces axinellae]|uniref:Uncharacterized protein n=1 Tax=Streptomyces axinellae TaxID=552788 RepID=A0ABN3QUG1_9ACTN
MWSYKDEDRRIPGNSTKRPTVGNDTGTPDGPHGTGAHAEGSVRDTALARAPRAPGTAGTGSAAGFAGRSAVAATRKR